MTGIVILQTTASSEDEANKLSEALIDANVAACVQIQGPIRTNQGGPLGQYRAFGALLGNWTDDF